MNAELHTSIRHEPDGTPVVTATGEIDMSTAQRFGQVLAEAVRGSGRLIVDLSAVDHLDSAGTADLFTHATGGGMEIVVGANRLVASLLDLCGIAELAKITPPDR
jgi:anti-sigma B factor antagonist